MATKSPTNKKNGSVSSKSGNSAGKNVKRPQASSGSKSKANDFITKRWIERQHSREFLGIVFMFLGFLFFLCWFNTNTILLGPLSKLVSGFFGKIGGMVIPFIMFYSGCILFTSHGAPVKMRTWSCFFSMVFLCGVFHSIADLFGNLQNNLNFGTLWKNGQQWKSGGLIPGFIAELLERCITRFGAIVLMTICLILCLLATRNVTLPGIITALKKREPRRVKADTIVSSERFVERVVKTADEFELRRKQAKARNASYDMPLDDPPFAGRKNKASTRKVSAWVEPEDNEPETEPVEEISFPKASKKAVEKRKPKVIEEPEIIETPQTESIPLPPPREEEKTPKVTKAEATAAADSISREIAENATEDLPYVFPSLELLNRGKGSAVDATSEMRENSKRLADTLYSFGVTPHIVDVIRGPSVTRYELELDPGVKLSKITNLSDDIALALGAQGVRISAIPDKISVVGIEVPNKVVNTVYAKEVIGSGKFNETKSRVSFAVGKDISGNCIIGDIGKMPHMLIAGTTGSGKSVCMNTLIISLLYKAKPDEVKLIMVDPKMVELGVYNGIPHLLIPVVTDPEKAAGALQWTVTEMLRRYRLMSDEHVRDLESYNKAIGNDPTREKLAQIVVVIDELADLMLVAAKEVEESICRIAQMGRASGIHLVIATQRPSADVITGTMKANIPSRIAFSVSSAMESRIILDMQGAEKLVGRGDMLFAPHGQGKPQRVQGCFITDDEVSRVVEFIKQNTTAEYSDEVMEQIEKRAEQGNGKQSNESSGSGDELSDEMLPAAVEVILETGQASVSMLQRRLKLGYARAARIVDEMEERGIVGPFEGAKPRQLLITRDQWEMMKSGGMAPVPDEIP